MFHNIDIPRPANSPDLVWTVPIFSPCPDCPDQKPKCPDIGAISENQNGNLAFVKILPVADLFFWGGGTRALAPPPPPPPRKKGGEGRERRKERKKGQMVKEGSLDSWSGGGQDQRGQVGHCPFFAGGWWGGGGAKKIT